MFVILQSMLGLYETLGVLVDFARNDPADGLRLAVLKDAHGLLPCRAREDGLRHVDVDFCLY
jgi:hypothetical protein